MRKDRFAIAAVLALSLGAANPWAFNCYEVIDKDQNVTYRATHPPFGMAGDVWTKGQNELRAKNLHMGWQDARDCSPQVLGVKKAEATTKAGDMVFDPDLILRATPEYMTASGRPTGPRWGGSSGRSRSAETKKARRNGGAASRSWSINVLISRMKSTAKLWT